MNYTFYRLKCVDPAITEFYIGSTTDFKRRCREHKRSCNKPTDKNYNLPVYQYIRANGGFDNWTFEIIDIITFDKKDALKHERRLIEVYGATLNKVRPIVTREEKAEYNASYRTDHQEKMAEYNATYYEEHQEEISENKRKYYAEHHAEKAEYQRKYNAEHRAEKAEYSRKYKAEHREEILERKRQYWEDHKDEINAKKREKYHQKKSLLNI